MKNYRNIIWKYLSILFILFALIISVRIFHDHNHYEHMLDNKVSNLTLNMQKMFASDEESLKNKYSMLSLQLMKDEHIFKLFQNNDGKKLYEYLKYEYQDFIHLDKHLHVMHFMDTKNITVIRMHKPSSYGDDLTARRPMVAYVNKSLKQQNGFEVGKNGIVYRVTIPYVYNNKHIGVLEFGIRPSYFVDSINKQYDVVSQILVKEELLSNLVAKKEYKRLGDYSVISQSALFKELSTKIDFSKDSQVVKFNSKYYVVFSNLNLNNYQDENVAKILIAKDISAYVEKNHKSLIFLNIITIGILFFVFLLLYIIFAKYTNEINNLKKQSSYLEKRANRDTLTKAYNKEYLNNHLIDFLKIQRNGVILFIDIDHFKECNDTYGHLIGDKILIQLSKVIQNYLRSDDLFVRWGGEEFLILFEDVPFDIAIRKAESIRLLIENTKFPNNIVLTISIGATKIQDTDTVSSLLNRADDLLYQAKNSGRNKVVSDK